MDELRPNPGAAKRTSAAGGIAADTKPAVKQDGAKMPEPARVAEDVLNHAGNAAGEVIDHAKEAAEQLIEQTKNAAGDAVTSFAQDVAEQAPEIARRVRDQAGAAAETLYRQGGEYLSPKVRAYPLAALVIAGVVGYSLGYLFSRS
jgi:ElaB/YqjD/DUF883 family membrane-anchored ribosome-binding protein